MLISFYILSSLFVQLKCYVEVNIKQGVIIGVKEMTLFEQKWYYAFYGVPYAKPPVARLRFQNPKPLTRFSKPFDATTEYHGACAQAHIVHKHALYGYEDCLHLNIYTPHLPQDNKQNLKPVIVWIHGYAFTSSFSHVYGSDFLIEHDVLFISLTHRIGAFGFLKLNESDPNSNMGLRDIITGLKWIRNNVKYFGGDKKQITLMGGGSGATLASLLLLTKYRKLFQKIIIQSGSMFSPSLYQDYNTLEASKFEKEIKKAGYKDHMTAPTIALVTASNKIYSSKDIINSQRPIVPFKPSIGKINFDEYENSNNEKFDIPILAGLSTQESLSEALPFIHNPSYLKYLGKYFKYMVPFLNGCSYNDTTKSFTTIAGKIKQRYFKKYPDIALQEFLKYTSDIHKYPIFKFIKTHVKNNNRKVFVYKFNYVGNFNVMKSTSLAGIQTKVKGAAHGDESCYVLKCEPLWENYVKIKDDVDNRDRRFIKQIAKMWANFAKFGDPTPANYGGNITWLPMTEREDNLLLIQKHTKMIDSKSETGMFNFWNKIYRDYYSQEHCSNVHDEL
ncbi:esterase E4-like [Epargyreus clarus]|uniref:esterase E4-like n=1 Tax=Epargyreus clarus TaxID=520877 RepID=UPI003C2DF9BC